DVAIDVEHRGDARRVVVCRRRDLEDAGDLREHVLDRIDEAGLDVLRRRAGPRHAHGDLRLVDIGELADADPRDRDDAEQDRAAHQHPREHRPAQAEVGQVHGVSFVWWPLPLPDPTGDTGGVCGPAPASTGAEACSSVSFAPTLTGAPSVSGSIPRTAIISPSLTPRVSSTPPSGVCMPSWTTF